MSSPGPALPPQGRAADLAAGLAAVQDRIGRACRAAGRPREDVRLVAVSKTWPASDLRLLHALGAYDLGENRDREARDKAAELAALRPPVRWHFVGSIQTRKARSVATYASVVHSLDRDELATALSAGAVRAGREIEVLVQVSLDGDPGRGGALGADVPRLADRVAALEGLVLAGVMAVAPRDSDPEDAFTRLARVAAELRASHPRADAISAGMSGDLEQAVAAGATYVRVGTAVFGHRPPVLG